MLAYDATSAAEAVRRGIAGDGTPEDAEILADLFRRAAGKREALARIEREANALAAIVADILDGQLPNDVVDDLPHDARRRVIAYRHRGSFFDRMGTAGRDQFGPLPKVPPRTSVMRERARTIDVDPVPDREEREPFTIEGYVIDTLDKPSDH